MAHSVSPSPALLAAQPSSPSPLDSDGACPLGRAVQLLAEGCLEEAERLAREAVSASPGDPAAHAVRGVVHERAGRAGEAIAAYRAALYLDPALFQVRVLLADCFLRLGLKDRAGHQFREVLAGLSGGRARALDRLPALPLPDRDHAARRCRQGLREA
jgi:Flp pilus assembly protein TadD